MYDVKTSWNLVDTVGNPSEMNIEIDWSIEN